MYNKVLVTNPLYNKLKIVSTIVLLIAVIFTIPMIVVGMVNSRNLNGEVVEVSGTVSFVGETDNEYFIITLDDQDSYCVNPIEDRLDDWGSLQGKEITLVLPSIQLASEYRWILGVKQSDKILVDYNQTLTDKKADNRIILIVFGVLIGVFVLTSGGLYAWQKKTQPLVEQELASSYCEYSALRQPCCKAYRMQPFMTVGYVFLVVALSVALLLVNQFAANDVAARVIAVISLVLVTVATALLLAANYVILPKAERRYYAEYYPFDFTDVSHAAIRKKLKLQLQQELKAERKAFPHRYGDGGNGYLCDFTEKGLSLSWEQDGETEFAPSAKEVFGEGGDNPVTNHHLYDLTYDELDFEAVPYYRKKDRPLFIVIKSRIQHPEQLPDTLEMHNDIHIILDSNLLATLRAFDVKVENLDYLLENKEKLMNENCKKRSH